MNFLAIPMLPSILNEKIEEKGGGSIKILVNLFSYCEKSVESFAPNTDWGKGTFSHQ